MTSLFMNVDRCITKGISLRGVLDCSMVNLGWELCFLECPSLCASGFELGKSEAARAWEAEVKPPWSEDQCRLEAVRDRCRGAGRSQFVLAPPHAASSAPSQPPALLTNSGPRPTIRCFT